jgi:hypothetical protein
MKANDKASREAAGVVGVKLEETYDHAHPPVRMTKPCATFFERHDEIGGFFLFLNSLAGQSQDAMSYFHNKLIELSTTETEKAELKRRFREHEDHGPVNALTESRLIQ